MTIALVGLATGIAAAVEWVEALTIVLAVGRFKGWRSSLTGMVLAGVALAALVVIFGVALTSHVPIAMVRTLVGVFLLLFGLKWLYKAILRSSGLKALHDEAAAFEETREHLLSSRDHWIGLATSFNGVFLEGLEVVFIVIALGGLNNVSAAAAGAITALVLVAAVGVAFKAPLTQVPENAMKYVVGIMLTAFGTFFTGEGIGVAWWRDDFSLIPLILVYGLSSLLLVQFLKRPPVVATPEIAVLRVVRTATSEVWGPFVDDGSLALVAVAAVLAAGLFASRVSGQGFAAGVLLVGGVVLAIMVGLAGPVRVRRHEHARRHAQAEAQRTSEAASEGLSARV